MPCDVENGFKYLTAMQNNSYKEVPKFSHKVGISSFTISYKIESGGTESFYRIIFEFCIQLMPSLFREAMTVAIDVSTPIGCWSIAINIAGKDIINHRTNVTFYIKLPKVKRICFLLSCVCWSSYIPLTNSMHAFFGLSKFLSEVRVSLQNHAHHFK